MGVRDTLQALLPHLNDAPPWPHSYGPRDPEFAPGPLISLDAQNQIRYPSGRNSVDTLDHKAPRTRDHPSQYRGHADTLGICQEDGR